MIKALVHTNISCEPVLVSEDDTLQSALDKIGADYSTGALFLNDRYISRHEIKMTFKDFGITEGRCVLFCAHKCEGGC